MNKFFALLLAVLSGAYLLTLGVWVGPPDFIPILDEATAILVFVQAMKGLGVDVTRYLPFFGKKVPKTEKEKEGPVVDI